jgi:Protein of unknown function (DUF1629)
MSDEKSKPIAKRRQARNRTFYVMSFNYRRGGMPGYFLEDESVLPPGLERLPDFVEPPHFIFDEAVGDLPGDLEQYDDFWLISDRTKLAFESFDPAAFSFVPCDVRVTNGVWNGPRYWLCDVVRVLDALDEAKSRLKIGIQEDARYRDFGKKFYSFLAGAELVFREDAVGDAHVFRMAYSESTVICDQELRGACKSAGLKGILFKDVSHL